MTETAAWPFGTDADRDDPLTALRVPVVTSFKPQWGYIAAYLKPVTDGPDYMRLPPFGSLERPTEAEVQMLLSYIAEAKSQLRGGYVARMEARPLDVDNWSCGHVFIKYGPDDWGYHRNTWTHGFVPGPPSYRERFPDKADGGPMTLEQVMDRRHSIAGGPMEHWTRWKAEHPEVFGPCTRCKGSGIDPEHTAAEDYGTGNVRELETPCARCQLVAG